MQGRQDMKFIQTQTSLSAGQLSRSLDGRIDIQEYKQGCRELTNMVIMKEGGARKMAGYKFFDSIKYQPNLQLRKSYYFNTLEGDSIRLVLFPLDLSTVPALADDTDYFVGDYFSDGATYIQVVQDFNSGNPASYTTGDTDIFNQLALQCWTYVEDSETPIHQGNFQNWFGADVFTTATDAKKITAAQYEGAIFFAHASGEYPMVEYSAKSLGNLGPVAVNFSAGDVANRTPYKLNKNSGRNIVLAPYTGGVLTPATQVSDMTFSDGKKMNEVFSSGDTLYIFGAFTLGGITYYANSSFKVDGFDGTGAIAYGISSRVVGANFIPTSGTYSEWYYPMFSSINGYPRSVIVHDSRLVVGGTKDSPSTLCASAAGNPYFFNNKRFIFSSNMNWSGSDSYIGDIQNTDPYVFTVATSRAATITSLESSKVLTIGTSEKCYVATSTEGGLLGPLNVSFIPILTKSADGQSTVVDEDVFLTCNGGKILQMLKYNGSNGSSDSKEASVLSKDFYTSKCTRMAVDSNNSIVLYIKDNGSAHLVANSQAGSVLAHTTLDLVMDVYDASYDYASDSFHLTTSLGETFLTLSEIPYSVERAYEWLHGYAFIEGTVGVWATGLAEGTIVWFGEVDISGNLIAPLSKISVDSSGEFPYIITDTGNSIVYGQSKKGNICLMPVEAGQQWGSGQAAIKRVDTLLPRLYKTYSFKVKEYSSNFDDEVIVFDTDTNEPYTGLYRHPVDSTPNMEQVLCISNDRPEPFTVLSLTLRGQANDG